ncbi:MAG: hypothetical protein GC192_06945 [Bacteroidetes bacterium]|nr:hypothetical protein [Bacteroidota bacterium]
MAEKLSTPKSSFDELVKIVRGYAHAGKEAGLDDLAKLIGMNPTVISRNNKFLAEIGIIAGGNKKSVTDLGRKLGRAIEHSQEQDAQKYWKEAVQTNEDLSQIITTVRIKGGMTEDDLSNHVLYVSGQQNNQGNKTGSTAIVQILKSAGLIEESNGKIVVSKPQQENASEVLSVPEIKISDGKDTDPSSHNIGKEQSGVLPAPSFTTTPQIAINIQLQLPATDDASIYEKLFKALREQLINPKDS